MTIQPMTDEEQAAWWSQQPRRPKLSLKLEPIPAYEATITMTCRVCGTRDSIRISDAGLLCRQCRVDLDSTHAHVEAQITTIDRELNAGLDAWKTFLVQLEPALAERWQKLYGARTDAEMKLQRAQTGKVRSDVDPMDAVRAAKAAHAAVLDKIARSRAASPEIESILRAEEIYKQGMAELSERRRRFEIAIQEIEAAKESA